MQFPAECEDRLRRLNAEIGTALFISANTVRNHVQRISAKLGASSRLDIAMSALRRGLVELPR